MATYYRWRQSELVPVEKKGYLGGWQVSSTGFIYVKNEKPNIIPAGDRPTNKPFVYDWSTYDAKYGSVPSSNGIDVTGKWLSLLDAYDWEVGAAQGEGTIQYKTSADGSPYLMISALNDTRYGLNGGPGDFVAYLYNVNASAYPNNNFSGNYWYDQRTTITSPVAPTGLTYPNPIITSSATVSWTASVTNVPIYAVSTYEVSYSTNGGSTWTVAGTTADTSLSVTLPTSATSIQFRVRAQDSNGQWSSYATGTASTVLLSPTLTVPSMAMQGQQITVNWTAIDGATSYTLQRQANTDDGWVQVYSGNALTFTEIVGTWTTVQYQVQAVFSSGAGGWATSGSIPVVSAAALVISGQDEDLGTLTADVPYTVSSDTGNPITLTRKVNGNLVATLTVQNGFAYTIPVVDLPTGSGTIEISATVNATSGGQVSATRTWTYTKTPFVFPNAGSTGQLTLQGNNIFPGTFAECVRVPTNWGGTLDKALELLYDAANSAVISVGTYEGSGTYGVDNPNTLTISPSPQVVTIYGGGQTLVISSTDTSSPAYIDGTTVKWYSTVSAAEQMNSDGVTYSYVAVAKGVTV